MISSLGASVVCARQQQLFRHLTPHRRAAGDIAGAARHLKRGDARQRLAVDANIHHAHFRADIRRQYAAASVVLHHVQRLNGGDRLRRYGYLLFVNAVVGAHHHNRFLRHIGTPPKAWHRRQLHRQIFKPPKAAGGLQQAVDMPPGAQGGLVVGSGNGVNQ